MNSATAIIIGGGVIGLSTAYHLAQKQFGKIILLEKGPVGDGASSRAGGIITGLLWTETGVLARKISLALYRTLSEALEGYRFQDVGCLNLFDPSSWPERKNLLPLYDRLDVPYEILNASEIHHRWPQLTPDESTVGLHDPLGGYSEPHRYIPALAQKVRQLGVDIWENRLVTDLLRRNDRIVGVTTANGDIEADAVICTVHIWTLKLFEQLGWTLPMKAFVHQRYLTRPMPAPMHIPAINANGQGGYIRPAERNRLLVGGETAERKEYLVPSLTFNMTDLSAPAGLKETLRTNFIPLVPGLAQTAWDSEKVGLLSFSMDGEPILGPVRQFPGLYIGSSFHSGGFAYNPAAGLLLAELIADGRPSIDLRAFAPDRFDPVLVQEYLATPLAQKDAVQRRH